jgi:acetylornithine/N-succinyldiaminopimelate aminotransferase
MSGLPEQPAAAALPAIEPHAGLGELWTERYAGSIMNTFGPPKQVLVRGEGCWVWDADGKRYLDLLGGLAVNSLGHAHPLVVGAITAQMTTLGHVSNFFATAPQIALAERLLALVSGASVGDASVTAEAEGRVFFTNSGTEANEAAFKIARRTGRPKIVATTGSFHGRTMGALSLTGQPAKQEPFAPLVPGVVFVPYGDADALAAEVDETTAAVFLEPIQGEAGVVVPPAGYLAAARDITTRAGALLVLDEVQTGVGRTGDWFAFTREGIRPDVVTLAKGLGAGFPIGACIGLGAAASLLGPGSHGTTFGGNPVACAAGLGVLHVLERDDLLTNVRTVGAHLTDRVRALGHPLVTGVRGSGLLLGIVLAEPLSSPATAALMDAGFIVNDPAPDVIRLAPPLVLTVEEADQFVAALPGALDRALAERTSGVGRR